MKKILMLFVLVLTTTALTLGQTVQVTGIVTSQEDGLTIPGASVTVKGTTIGTLTSADGGYSSVCSARRHYSRFSFIGMKTMDDSNRRDRQKLTL